MSTYVTKQRKVLQDYLSNHVDQELSVKQIAQDLAPHKVSQSAIYRNLAMMEQEKIVVQCRREGSRELYYRYLGHDDCRQCLHISCKICTKTEHIPITQSHFLKEYIEESCDVILDLPSSIIYGICSNCKLQS